MFGRKKDEAEGAMEETEKTGAAGTPPLRSTASSASVTGQRAQSSPARPEIVRRAPDIHGAAHRRGDSGEGKKLVVGRDIVLSGEINSCDKLVVEGRVEANINDCREIEVAESGTFKGQAEIDLAEISGTFEGTLTARQLLIVRSTGRITGKVRFGQLEIERGGEIVGDVQVCGPETSREAAPADPPERAVAAAPAE